MTTEDASEPTSRRKAAAKGEDTARTFWDDLADIGLRIPDEELEQHPRDGARNLEHYLYGAPKQA